MCLSLLAPFSSTLGSPFRVKLVGDPVDSSSNDTFRKPTPYMDTNLGTIDENDEDDTVPQVGVRIECNNT